MIQVEEEARVTRELGEEFPLYDPLHSKFIPLGPTKRLDVFRQSIVVPVEGFQVPLEVSGIYSRHASNDCFTPYNPSEGYTVTNDDFDLMSRRRKFEETLGLSAQNIDEKLNPLTLVIEEISHKTLLDYSLVEFGYSLFEPPYFPVEIRKILEKLRASLTFPGSPKGTDIDNPNFRLSSQFEARPQKTGLNLGEIVFSHYYPVDLGPLATTGNLIEPIGISEGLFLAIPYDFDALQLAKVRFRIQAEKYSPLTEETK